MSYVFSELLKNYLIIASIALNIFFIYKNENIETKYLNNIHKPNF